MYTYHNHYHFKINRIHRQKATTGPYLGGGGWEQPSPWILVLQIIIQLHLCCTHKALVYSFFIVIYYYCVRACIASPQTRNGPVQAVSLYTKLLCTVIVHLQASSYIVCNLLVTFEVSKLTLLGHRYASLVPRLFVWVERRAWYPLFAHASIKNTCALNLPSK